MQVIPVIDLMHGQVVRGVGGRRDEYRAVTSVLAGDARPESIARALAGAGFCETYVADLDAIGGSEPAWTIYAELMRWGLDLWVDAGLSTAEDAQRIAQFETGGRRLAAIVVGLESLPDPDTLAAILDVVGPRRLIFSLDLKSGAPLIGAKSAKKVSGTKFGEGPIWFLTPFSDLTPLQIAVLAVRVGVRRMIVLDLAQVGLGRGVGTETLCRELRALDSRLQIIAGGGVRSMEDLRVLSAAGCDAALVASALHDGRLTPSECATTRRL